MMAENRGSTDVIELDALRQKCQEYERVLVQCADGLRWTKGASPDQLPREAWEQLVAAHTAVTLVLGGGQCD